MNPTDEPKQYTWENNDDDQNWSKILPDKPTVLPSRIRRIQTNASTAKPRFTELINDHQYAIACFTAFKQALCTPWYENLVTSSKRTFLIAINHFVSWLNVQDDISYNVVKAFETHRVNENNVLPQCTGATFVLQLLNNGKNAKELSPADLKFLNSVIKMTKLAKHDKRTSTTLTNWFTKQTWLYEELGDRYLKLESPSRLIASFQITIAATLLYLINVKKALSTQLEKDKQQLEDYLLTPVEFDQLDNHQKLARWSKLFRKLVKWENGKPANELSHCLYNDLITRTKSKIVQQRIKDKGVDAIAPSWASGGSHSGYVFSLPNFFISSLLNAPTHIEQMLASWLFASLMIQPSDVWKLKRNHIAIERNTQGQPRFVQVTYYKGRAGCKYEPPMLGANDITAKALIAYLESVPAQQSALFTEKQRMQELINPFFNCRINNNNDTSFLFLVWQDKSLQANISTESAKRKVSPIFIDAMQKMVNEKAVTRHQWKSINREKRNDHGNKAILRILPRNIFGLQHIKTSAVHSRSDQYRDGDLVNYNSHTSQTEKISYLTDDNKDWVNQAGRITRLTLHDIENSVYKPNLSAVEAAVNDKNIRTQIVASTDNANIEINRLGETINRGEYNFDIDDIIVIDSIETALAMLHYVEEASAHKHRLIRHNPEFFTRTVLVNVEWMYYTLGLLNAQHVNDARKQYDKIKAYLPELFKNEILGGVTS